MGCSKVDDAESIRAIHAGLDAGVTLFGAAANYGTGHCERVLGQALAGQRDDGRTLAQGTIAWIWARSERAIPIPGFKNVAQVEENARALHFGPLRAEQMEEVEHVMKQQTAADG